VLDRNSAGAYDDLLNFVAAFFAEWANHFRAFQPDASGDQGWLYDEFNADAKPPAHLVAADDTGEENPSYLRFHSRHNQY